MAYCGCVLGKFESSWSFTYILDMYGSVVSRYHSTWSNHLAGSVIPLRSRSPISTMGRVITVGPSKGISKYRWVCNSKPNADVWSICFSQRYQPPRQITEINHWIPYRQINRLISMDPPSGQYLWSENTAGQQMGLSENRVYSQWNSHLKTG